MLTRLETLWQKFKLLIKLKTSKTGTQCLNFGNTMHYKRLHNVHCSLMQLSVNTIFNANMLYALQEVACLNVTYVHFSRNHANMLKCTKLMFEYRYSSSYSDPVRSASRPSRYRSRLSEVVYVPTFRKQGHKCNSSANPGSTCKSLAEG